MIPIQPQYMPLSKLFDGRLFQIPEYQRAYSWTSHQRHDLFEDIKKTHAKGEDAGHFMAAVVCLQHRKLTLGTDEFQVMHVVDGQQRLTTLIVLFNAIKLALKKGEKAESKLADEIADLLVKPEGDELLLLQTNHDTSHYFADYLKKGLAPPAKFGKTLADREILKAIEECKSFVNEWKQHGESLLSLAALLKNRLYFLLHEINEIRTVYTVFEVLNSRGLEVSWLDRLKSNLMGAAFELKNANHAVLTKDLHTIWRDVYSVIGLRQGLSTEALRFAATLRVEEAPSRPLGEEDSADCLRLLGKNAKSIRGVAEWLLEVTKACDEIMKNPRLNAVTGIAQARLLAVAILLRNDIQDNDRAKLLRRWERVSFRIYGMLGYDKRYRVGDFVRLSWEVVNEGLSVKRIDAAIEEIGADFSIKDAVEELRRANCYEGWQEELRYLLYRYEEYLAEEQGLNFKNENWERIWMVSAAESIEHIWPRSDAPKKQMHRLGNLVLLPPKLNSKLQDRYPVDKVGDYRKTGLLIAGEVADMIESAGWDKSSVEKREKAILRWVAEEWAD